MDIIFIIFLTVSSFYILAKSCQEWHQFFADLSFPSGLDGLEEDSVEVPAEPVNVRYDVAAFTRRMEKIRETMDEDGLYDIVEPPPQTDFTGTEVITGQLEMDLERYRR